MSVKFGDMNVVPGTVMLSVWIVFDNWLSSSCLLLMQLMWICTMHMFWSVLLLLVWVVCVDFVLRLSTYTSTPTRKLCHSSLGRIKKNKKKQSPFNIKVSNFKEMMKNKIQICLESYKIMIDLYTRWYKQIKTNAFILNFTSFTSYSL